MILNSCARNTFEKKSAGNFNPTFQK